MRKEEIIKVLQENDSTILNFPDRGNCWGSAKWRGNTSGYVNAFLIWKYKVQKMAELFAGSGTCSDVCKDMGIDYIGADLNPNPVRPDIITLDAIKDDIPESFYDADMHFMHPPYSSLIQIPYAGSMFPDPTGELSKSDLGQMSWDEFMWNLNNIVMKVYAAMKNGSYMSILMGDIRRNGKFYSMLTDIVKPGEIQQIIVKKQNNYSSQNRVYQNRNYVPIVHEFVLVLKKIASYILSFQLPVKREMDIRDSESATWADVIRAVLQKLKGKASLTEIYNEVESYRKASLNPHWKEKVRQTLQIYKCFTSSNRGCWELVAA